MLGLMTWITCRSSTKSDAGTCNRREREIYQSPACIYKADSINTYVRRRPARHAELHR